MELVDARGPPPGCGQHWEVVGGAAKGGIVVRAGKELGSPEAGIRLATGALIREAELIGERLRFRRLTGAGPDTGWVSLKMKDKDLVVRTDKTPPPVAVPDSPDWVRSELQDRKMRVLALHGRASNTSIAKFQMAPLKAFLGKQAEWLYLDAPLKYVPEEDLLGNIPTDIELRLAQGKSLLKWFTLDPDGPGILQRYLHVEEAVDHLRTFIWEHHPIDVIVSFSQASNVVGILIDQLRREGVPVPWRLNVFFCGGWIRDQGYIFQEPSPHPTVQVSGGTSDPYFPGGEPSLSPLYTNLIAFGHEDGHSVPVTQPNAKEVFERVGREMLKSCQVKIAAD